MGDRFMVVLGGLAVAFAASPAAAQSRALLGWLVELDACASFMETGEPDVFATGVASAFPDWYLAYPGGGVCNDAPDPCLGPDVTFIYARANGAVTLTEADQRNENRVTCAHTPNWPHHTVAEHRGPTEDWIAAQIAAGRLRAAGSGAVSLSWVGCRANGEEFVLSFDFARPLAPFFVFAAAGRPCAREVS